MLRTRPEHTEGRKAMRYLSLLVHCIARQPATVTIAVLLALAFATPLALDCVLWGESIVAANAQNAYTTLKAAEDAGAYDSAPDYIRTENERDLKLLRGVVDAKDPHTFWAAVAKQSKAELDEIQEGTLQGDALNTEAEYRRAVIMSMEKNPRTINYVGDLPPAQYLPAAIASLPSVAWLLPSLVVGVGLCRITSPQRLLGARTIPATRRVPTVCVAASISCVAILVVAFLPGMVLSGLRNGFTSSGLPVVFIKNGFVVVASSGQALSSFLALVVLENVFVSCAIVCLGQLTGGAAAGGVVGVALCLLPLSDSYLSPSSPLSPLLKWLPTSYFDASRLMGFAGAFGVDICEGISLDTATGCIVLLSWTACFILLTLVVGFALSRYHAARRQRRGQTCPSTSRI
jgi:hypothetical protein